jgi:hypothetical protein
MRKLLLSFFLILGSIAASAQLAAPGLEFSNHTKTGFTVVVTPIDPTTVDAVEIVLTGNGKNETSVHVLGAGTFVSVPFTGLLPGATYTISTRVFDCAIPPCPTASTPTVKTTSTLVDFAPRAAIETTSNCPQYVGLKWSYPSTGGAVTNIIIQKTHGGPWYHVADVPPYQSEYYDFDARPGVYTAYKVYTVNALGELTESNTVSLTVKPYVAPAAPLNLRAVSKTNNSITVQWENPEEDWVCKSDVRASYYISVKRAWEPEFKVYGVTYPYSNTFTISGLEENEVVDIGVWSWSDQGIQGGWAKITERTHGKALIPTNVIGVAYKDQLENWALGISWTHAGDDADYYHIDYSLDGTEWTKMGFVKQGVKVINHVNLKEGVPYTYRVKAGNYIYGDSEYAYMDGYVTINPTQAPTAPYGVVAKWSGADVVLTWVDDTNKESKYIIERSTTETGTYTKAGEVGRDIITFTDKAPTGTDLFYRVVAENAIGASAPSKAVKISKPAGSTGGGVNMVVYPNPTVDKINVTVPALTAPVDVKVYNQANQLVYSKSFKADSAIEVNMKKYIPGAYNVVVSSGEFKESKKIVKN